MSKRIRSTSAAGAAALAALLCLTAPAVTDPPRPESEDADVHARVHVEIPVLPLRQYARHCADLVHGRVAAVRFEADAEPFACTVYTLAVETSLRGTSGSEVEVWVAGGGNVVVDGAPRFELGEEVALFLTRTDGDGPTGILGLGQGTYRVARDAADRAVLHGLHAPGGRSLAEFVGALHDELATLETRGEEPVR